MEGITQLTTTASGKQRGTNMQSRAILLIAIMILAYQSPFATTELDTSADPDNTSGRSGEISNLLYYGSWVGDSALVNQTPIASITPMTYPWTGVADSYSYSNSDSDSESYSESESASH